jgi:hypothetical protein
MFTRLIVVALAVLTLAGCGSLGCGAGANNRSESGGCGSHVTFLR